MLILTLTLIGKYFEASDYMLNAYMFTLSKACLYLSVSLPTPSYVMCLQNTLEYVDGLVQEIWKSSALAMELRLSCIDPSMWETHNYSR